MRIVFMGSPEFAVPSLNALVEAGHDVVAAYAQPPRPAGRGKAERKTAVHARADELGIEVRTPKTLRDEEEQAKFRALDADMAIVAAYGLILPKPILEAPKAGCINVHASLLPRWRGAAPIQRAILAGDEISGVTLMQMDEGLDTGPMLARQTLDIRGKNSGQVTEEMAILGARLLIERLEHPTAPEAQPVSGSTYAAKIDKAETRIDFTDPVAQVLRQVRAFAPSPGAWFEYGGERIKILEAKEVPVPAEAGQIADDEMTIGCVDGSIWPVILQRAGRAPMTSEDFLRGFHISRFDFVDGYPHEGWR
jgi:methionyl-tRNA formyltransferase